MTTPLEREARRRLAEFEPDCPLVDARVRDDPVSRCNWCGEPLPLTKAGAVSLQRRFDRAACSDAFWRNHGWTTAKGFALLRALVPLETATARMDLREIHALLGDHYPWALRRRCERCRRVGSLEVNHVLPRNGAGYGNGCHHHQTNLEPLCHECHVAETTLQIRERRGIPLEGRLSRRSREALPDPLWGAA